MVQPCHLKKGGQAGYSVSSAVLSIRNEKTIPGKIRLYFTFSVTNLGSIIFVKDLVDPLRGFLGTSPTQRSSKLTRKKPAKTLSSAVRVQPGELQAASLQQLSKFK